jgi:hypothetical protein
MKKWIYRHFKGTLVEVIDIALHSETMEEMVVYLHPDSIKWKIENSLWVRPKKMFLENVESNWEKIPRFKYIWNQNYENI